MTTEKLSELFAAMCEKAHGNLLQIPAELPEYPACHDGNYFAPAAKAPIPLSHIFCWTQSFFTGMAALSYAATQNEQTLAALRGFFPQYHAKVFDTPLDTMHDLGFLYTPYSVLLHRITGDEAMLTLSLRAADLLCERFVEKGQYIRAWGRMDGSIPPYVDSALAQDQFFQKSDGLAIIDCMMNLPLLFYAYEHTKNERYRSVAVAHANTTLRHFVREDASVRHAFRFAPDGTPQEEFNGCGYGVGSYWARGASWAIYGFAIAHRYTGDAAYLHASKRLLDEFVRQCGENPMPVWDFRLPPETPALYCGKKEPHITWDVTDPACRPYAFDTSAAMVVACAADELARRGHGAQYEAYASRVLDAVPEYLNLSPATPGLLKRQNGCDVYTSFGDYYCMELFYRRLHRAPEFFW